MATRLSRLRASRLFCRWRRRFMDFGRQRLNDLDNLSVVVELHRHSVSDGETAELFSSAQAEKNRFVEVRPKHSLTSREIHHCERSRHDVRRLRSVERHHCGFALHWNQLQSPEHREGRGPQSDEREKSPHSSGATSCSSAPHMVIRHEPDADHDISPWVACIGVSNFQRPEPASGRCKGSVTA
jgi:hypothetical protein